MSLVFTRYGGFQATKNVLRGPIPNLKRFNIEQSGINNFRQNLANSYSPQGISYHVAAPIVLPTPSFGVFSFRTLNYFVKKHAFKVGFVTAVVKAVSADIVAQKVIEKREKLDFKRTAVFFCFGALYSGLICNVLYSRIYPAVFATRSTKLNAILSAACDNFVNSPFIMFPLLYVLKSGGQVKEALMKYKQEAWEACQTSWKIWIPAHCVTFSLIPYHLRLPYVSCVSFVFFTVVSLQQNVFEQRRLMKIKT